jgi:hypothetical protein
MTLVELPTYYQNSSASPSPDSNYNGDKVKKSENGSVQINFTEEEIELVKRTISYRLSFVMDLPFYLHNVLLVAAWSAMEGYVQALLAQMYTRYPDLLSSEKKVTFAEIISSGENLIGYLVAKEIDDVGRKNFGDLQSYLGSKIKLQFSNKYVKALYDAYFLRNVIAHSAGFLRDDQLELVPKGVDTEGSELRIGREYLNSLIKSIREAVLEFDDSVRAKFAPPGAVVPTQQAAEQLESRGN